MNRAILLGNLGRDPEMRSLSDGSAVANLSLATSERWKDKNTGERREKTEWHRVVAFGRLAEIMSQYLRKGSKVLIEGKITTRKWQDQSGVDKYTTEIVAEKMEMIDSKDSGSGRGSSGGGDDYPSGGQSGGSQNGYHGGASGDFDDEIPF